MKENTVRKAVDLLAGVVPVDSRIVVFGSHARGTAQADSDLDLLVIEPEVKDRAREMVRLRRALRPMRIPVDVLVYSESEVSQWGDQPGSALYWALREGQVMHG
jgi:uncharacterized protein